MLIKTAKEIHSAIHKTSFGTLKSKIGRLYVHNQCSKQNGPIFDTSRNFEGWFCREKSTNFCSKDVRRSVMKETKTFFDSWYQNNWFLRNSGPSKIRLLQCYVVLWIHNTDAICTLISKKWFDFSVWNGAAFAKMWWRHRHLFIGKLFKYNCCQRQTGLRLGIGLPGLLWRRRQGA